MKKLAILFTILMIPAAASAQEFEGVYELEYSELGLGLNIGLIVGGHAVGVDWVLPLETLPEDFFDDLKADLFEMIDQNPWIPPEEKEELKASIEAFLDALLEHWNTLVQDILGDLPETVTVEQAGWPLEALMTARLDDDEFEWPGLINLETQEFGMAPLIQLTWQGIGPWGSSAALHAILADGVFSAEEGTMQGHFLNLGEMAFLGPHAVVLAGVGVGGAFAGDRDGDEPEFHGCGDLQSWLRDQGIWARVHAETARKLGVPLQSSPDTWELVGALR